MPVDAWYEWQATKDGKKPFAFARIDRPTMASAGLWESWLTPGTEKMLQMFDIITTAANSIAGSVHDRMPVVVSQEAWPVWLGEAGGEALSILRSALKGDIDMWPVSPAVNSPRNNGPELLNRYRMAGKEKGPNMKLKKTQEPFDPPFALTPCPRVGDLFATFIEQYARAVCNRMLPALEITADEKADLAIFDQQYQSASFVDDVHSWPDGEFSNRHDIGVTVLGYAQMERHNLIRHMLGLGFAGLFHVFERQVLEVLRRLDCQRNGAVLSGWDDKGRMSFDDYKGLLSRGGYPIPADIETVLDRVRLIGNAMKHGSPDSIVRLHKRYPKLFWEAYRVNKNETPTLEFLDLTRDMLLEDAKKIAEYWRNFPHEAFTYDIRVSASAHQSEIVRHHMDEGEV